MFTFSYKANFCSDCGVDFSSDKLGWQQKILAFYLCNNCIKRLRFPIIKSRILLITLLFSLTLLINEYKQSPKNNPPYSVNLASSFTQTDLPTSSISNFYSKTTISTKTDNSFCTGKTKKGKKCKRKIKYGSYCWQHKPNNLKDK